MKNIFGKFASLGILLLFALLANAASADKKTFSYDDFKLKILAGPYVTCVDEGKAVVVFLTDGIAQSWVEFKEVENRHFYYAERERAYESPMGRKLHTRVHKVKIDRSGKPFTYRAMARKVLVDEGYRGVYGFSEGFWKYPYKKRPPDFTRFLDAKKNSAKFILVGNLQGEGDKAKLMLSGSKSCDFAIINGNFSSKNQGMEEFINGFLYRAVEDIPEIPLFFTRGANETSGFLRDSYFKLFPSSSGQTYYSFKHGPLFVIVLDAFDVFEKSAASIFDVKGFMRDQSEWLEKVLSSSEYKNSQMKIFVMNLSPLKVEDETFKEKILPKISSSKADLLIASGESFSFEENSENVEIPVLVNASDDVLSVEAKTDGNLEISFRSLDGSAPREPLKINALDASKREK